LYGAGAETGLETDFVSYSGTIAAFFLGRTRQLSAGSSLFWWAVGVSFNESISKIYA
jgi:hypothetical protein